MTVWCIRLCCVRRILVTVLRCLRMLWCRISRGGRRWLRVRVLLLWRCLLSRCLRGVLVCRSRVRLIRQRWSLHRFRRRRRVRRPRGLPRVFLQVLLRAPPRLLLLLRLRPRVPLLLHRLLRALMLLLSRMIRRPTRRRMLNLLRCSHSCRWFRRWWRRITLWWLPCRVLLWHSRVF